MADEPDNGDPPVMSASSVAAMVVAEVIDLSDDVEPGERCAVCLESITTRTCLDKCFHEFCHACILQWSELSRQCPLCKTSYATLIYDIKSDADYQTVRRVGSGFGNWGIPRFFVCI